MRRGNVFPRYWEPDLAMESTAPASENPAPTRKLVAILSVHVVGYSHIMGQNNHATVDILTIYWQIMRDRISELGRRELCFPAV